MKILFIGCHQVLEYDEVKLLTDLGHDVFSYQGSYMNPEGHFSLHRPSISGAEYHEEMAKLSLQHPKTKLPREIVEWCDVVILMHTPEWIPGNWQLFRELKKPVIWRSIGQSTPRTEKMIRFYADEGLTMVRYSPNEAYIKHYAGEDAVIRFYKDSEEFAGWYGGGEVINITQSLKGRRVFCHHDQIVPVVSHFGGKIYGNGNDDLGDLNGGQLTYDVMKQKLREASVFIYGGSWPAPYTLAFQEAFMTGTPIVSISQNLAERIEGIENIRFFEVSEMIENGVTGFVCDSVEEMKEMTQKLLDDKELSKDISRRARRKAIDLFGERKIKNQWATLLSNLKGEDAEPDR